VLVLAALPTLLALGCDQSPPLDELSLREALGAEPRAIAALPVEARRRLAERFEAARAQVERPSMLRADVRAPSPAGELVRALDGARTRDGRDALTVYALGAEEGTLHVAPLSAGALVPADDLPADSSLGPLPDSSTRELEQRALDGRAGSVVRALVRAAGASRLERVIGWPAAAAAVGDTVYVNAAWLVALAALDDDADGGAPAFVEHASARAAARSSAPSAVRWTPSAPRAPAPAGATFATGDTPVDMSPTSTTPPPGSPPSAPPPDSCGDGCDSAAGCASAGAGSSCDSSSCDSSSSDSSSCDSSSSDSSCSGDASSCGGAGDCNCSTAHRPRRPRLATLIWLLLPLCYLAAARRRR
jgi:hypothetical protein